jgi:cell fate regulator YaaT (PSP1 superfamily)
MELSSSDRIGLVQFNLFKAEWCSVPAELELQPGELVIIGDDEGEDLGRLKALETGGTRPVEGIILRRASPAEIQTRAELDARAAQALELFRELRTEYNINMQVVGAHLRFDKKKICFYFIAEERVNFRMLHKAIASALNLRVAIKQIGVRDHTRLLGGLGICGRVVCCKQFLRELKPITLRMARQQNLFVEPNKISGLCGKLLCCLSYEEGIYEKSIAACPRVGERVKTSYGVGSVIEVNALTHQIKVRYEDGTERAIPSAELKIE